MGGTKRWWESKAIWGALIGAGLSAYNVTRFVLRFAGASLPEIPAELRENLVEICLTVASIVGTVIAVIGRIRAREVIE